ncbi:glycan metabolism protein RagB [Salegentibacter salinarum]|uniref:Glycan metabolism protein RagB n=1 Tax=Salegentibacter salinarum TaxID=447422 RepID=A0A2N0U0D1_9FLAO|nr:RagB/SusD family nutrient uptake outer membrane protein [Salegentibacter salinarum]PKD20386.1 glycan metabolism protein RagB [Salegentibacter salinarum]SKB85325.1 Starch-binding associating with outer membrane [Salegentibacter salinarum]
MKKIIILCCGLMMLSCSDDYLDQVPDDRLTFDETFSKQNTVRGYLANIYSRFPNEFSQRYTTSANSGPWTGASDEAEYVWGFHMGNNLNIADWNATTQNVSNLWSNFYRGIRASTTLINSIDQCQNCSADIKEQYAAEARILRAFYYYNLMRSWGPILLMPETVVPTNANLDELGLERNSIDAVTNYIVSELDKGAEALDGVNFDGQNAGRMSTPFAMAIKEKTLLFAASPLYNGNSDYSDLIDSEGNNLVPQSYDQQKWKKAADAAKAFIDKFVPSSFELYKEFNNDGSLNPFLSVKNSTLEDFNVEIIYAIPRGNNSYQYDVTPLHIGVAGNSPTGAGGLSVTQEMVDAFFTNSGRSIDDPQSGYRDSGFSDFQAPDDFAPRTTFNPWTNREPRFYAGVTYNNRLWLNRNFGDIVTTTWYSGNSGIQAGTNDYPPTGYIVRKKAAEDYGARSLPYMRLAEIYLDYAEALNEYDPGNPDILKYVNLIRERAGIPEYGDVDLPAPSGQDAVREAIHKERRIELFVENVRYFDARRWKIAEDAFGGDMHGKDVNARDEQEFYNTVVFEKRVFRPQDYLWPIPQDEINANPKLIQNPGW